MNKTTTKKKLTPGKKIVNTKKLGEKNGEKKVA